MENMLDWPHLPFVHASTIGRNLVSRSGGHMDIDVEPVLRFRKLYFERLAR